MESPLELKLRDLRDDYVGLVNHVIKHGLPVAARGLATRELTAMTLIFENTLEPLLPIGVGRGVNTMLAALEALQLVSGVSRFDLVEVAAPGFARVLVDQEDPDYGAYGPRIVEQLADCVELLRIDPATRQAVCSIWNKGDLRHKGDKPCTVFLQFLVRLDPTGKFETLELHTHMRSQDVWLGVPYDVFMFTQLQHTVANELRIPAGQFVHHVTSLHIYERDLESAGKLHTVTTQLDTTELPLGIVSASNPAEHGYDDGFSVAAYLLEGNSTPAEDVSNHWYAAQLEQVEALLEKADAQV